MKKAFQYSLKHSIPILISFIPVGLAYGILMVQSGRSWICTGLCSLTVFAGSLQFLMVDFFAGGVTLVSVIVLALLLNSRHIFYGIPFIEKWRQYGPLRYILIFALPDEAFSLHCSNDFDDGNEQHKKWTYVFDALLVFFYWVSISIIGALVGTQITFDTTGIDFSMTALFIVILINQIRGSSTPLPAIVAACSSVLCLLVLGPSNFILPSLIITVAALIFLHAKLETAEEKTKCGAETAENNIEENTGTESGE